MGIGHGHGHGHGGLADGSTAAAAHRGRMVVVLVLTLGGMAVQVAGGLVSGSLALLADAGHMAADSFGIVLALFAIWIAARPFSPKRTFGFQRAEILAAAANALLLFGLCGYIAYETVHRLADPQPVAGPTMLAVALLGLAVNIAGLLVLRRGQSQSLNLRGAYLEVFSDMLSSLGVIVAALLVWLTGWQQADSVVSLGIAAFIVPRAWSLLREAVHILLEATPRDMDLDEVRSHLLAQPGVLDVHDLHAWTITSGVPVMSAHVVVEEERLGECGRMLDELHACLSGHFDVEHSTLQLEPAGHASHEGARHH
ncbi:cation diffusion facilitator family transporter [Marinitenerispora sediminis]|uniref:Cation transporter n=1 Tax=Marinitenerispora sediminis TaxID=1931232 RepID=A0A368T7I8_9ACTN|nr:cation diffusion facilitator family transporter [Marinitenerispora sediminis]RCV52005.1 cation transporter [Marinitenerispora sediminis]RCV56916.1 cation transporter [Marinitenerispora sediminis]RCV60066.1 cation transporter [Marinitenerispora sediminis]